MAQSQGKGGQWLAVILCTLTAGLLARAAIIGDPGLRVPPVIAYIAAAIFLMGALAVLKQIAGIHRTVDGLAPLILAAFTAIGGWIALSPDAGSCEASFNGGPGTEVSGLGCRIPFGIGALISAAMTVRPVRVFSTDTSL